MPISFSSHVRSGRSVRASPTSRSPSPPSTCASHTRPGYLLRTISPLPCF